MASSSSSSSSSSSTPEDTKIDKILGVSNEGYLLEISLSSGLSRLSIDYNNPNQGCSFSPPVDNRYVYMVGGMNEYVDSADLDVFCFDLVDRTIQRCPPIITPKWEPTLILLGSKLFAFSSYKYFSEHICEVLDTASMSSVWRPLKICPNLPFFNDHLPSDRRNRHICYSVISYATHMNNLFVSLGCVNTSVTLCYNDSNDRWSHFSEMQLPFYGQGKFVDDICYGFPIPVPEKSPHGGVITRGGNKYYLASYKLAVNWESFDPKVSCQQLAKYSLSCIPDVPYSSPLCSFFVSSSNVFTIIREATIPKRHSFDVKKHSLEVDVVQLLSPTMKRGLLAPIKEKKRRLSPPPHCQFNVESYRRPRHFIEESCRLIDVPEVYPYVPPPPETETVTDDTQDSRLLKHMNILLPHPLGGIVGDYNL